MNVANSHNLRDLKKNFKEDNYCDITTFQNKYKKRVFLNPNLINTYQIKRLKEKFSEAPSSDTDFYGSNIKYSLPYYNQCMLLFI